MKAKKSIKFNDYLKEQLRDPEFKKTFDEEEVYASVAIQIAKLREKEHLTQKELAERLNTTQQTLSRLEDIHNKSYSIQTLIKLASVFHKRLKVEFV
jgi:DNA-binding XRE family transcriptional regulator